MTNPSTPAPKPTVRACPFCNAPAETATTRRDGILARCSHWEICETIWYRLEAWNTRPLEDALLEALRDVLDEHRDGYGLRCIDQVRAAIARAEGRS